MTRYVRDEYGRRWHVREIPPRQYLPEGCCALEFTRDDGEVALGVGQAGWMAASDEELCGWLAAALSTRRTGSLDRSSRE